MNGLTISPGDQMLNRFANQIGSLSTADGHKALARAVNRTTTSAQSRVIRSIAKQSSIPAKIVRTQIAKELVRPGFGAELEGKIVASGRHVSLKYLGARQFSYGVKAKIWGKVRRFEGTFIYAGTYRSGKEVGNGHVYQRVTSAGLPIARQDGPAVPIEMVRDQSAQMFSTTVEQMLPDRVRHELGRLLN
jgi:hypothetical protein